jgi:hypothetical protein
MPGQQSTTAPKDRPSDPPTSLQPIDQRIVIVRRDLESVFTELETILDVCNTVHKALEHQNATQDVDFAHVLQRCGSDPLYEQLLELTKIIEALGGTTSYSDDDQIVGDALMSTPEGQQQ